MIDDTGYVFSYSDVTNIEEKVNDILELIGSDEQYMVKDGYTFIQYNAKPRPGFIAFVEGEDETAKTYANILSISLSGIMQLHDEKFDKSYLIKNILLDNVMPGDVILKSKDLRINYEVPRRVLLVCCKDNTDYSAFNIVQSLFPDKSRDFVISLDESNIVLVKELHDGNDNDAELEEYSKSIVDTLSAEALVAAHVGIGTIAPTIRDIAKSYKEAQVALEVGKVFDTEKSILNYKNLGIGRLIYQLPTTLCELFLSEVFKKESLDVLDSEILYTIQKFFENNLNVSETSRQLYVHRNTLVYRLDKVQKLTGLDLRVFDHAIVFKVAMMVKKYLTANPIKM